MSTMDGTSVVSFPGQVGRARVEHPAADPTHLIALRDGVYRVPGQVRRLRVLAGSAWISLGGADHILTKGEQITFRTGAADALASALGGETLILEADTGRNR
jgi:hypothetical protein